MRFVFTRPGARRIHLGALFTALVLLTAAARAQTNYNVIEIVTLGGGESRAYSINNRGNIVGVSTISPTGPDEWHPFFWSNGLMIDIGTFGGTTGDALSINDLDYVVGTGSTPVGALHPYVWSEVFLKRDLGSLSPSGQFGAAHDLNNSNQVVGQSELSFLNDRAYLWKASTGMVNLGTLGGNYSVARGINDAGHVAGDSQTAAGQTHAFLYNGGPLIDLGTLGGSFSRAHKINSSGAVVGYSTLTPGGASPPHHGFLYTQASGMIDLGTLGGTFSEAFDINSVGDVVGYSEVSPGVQRAFIYTNGVMYNLNDFIPPDADFILTQARGINDKGYIVGYGLSKGFPRGFLLIPDNEPLPLPAPCSVTTSGPFEERPTKLGRLGAPQPAVFSGRP